MIPGSHVKKICSPGNKLKQNIQNISEIDFVQGFDGTDFHQSQELAYPVSINMFPGIISDGNPSVYYVSFQLGFSEHD
jgi:hypothetical protein